MRVPRSIIALLALTSACRLDIECVVNSECPQGQVCTQDLRCASMDAGAADLGEADDAGDVSVDLGDGGPSDMGDAGDTDDMGDMGDMGDVGAPNDLGDAGPAGPHRDAGRPPGQAPVGYPLPDGDAPLGDSLLLHFDAPISQGTPPENFAPRRPVAIACDGTCPSSEPMGAFGSAARFAAGDGLSAPGQFEMGNADGFTFELWLQPDSITGRACLVEVQDAMYDVAFCLQDGAPTLLLEDTPLIAAATPLTAGVWTHLAVVNDYDPCSSGQIFAIYINGVQTATAAGNPVRFEMPNVLIGGRGAEDFIGAVDELRLSGRRLFPEDLSPNRAPGCLIWSEGEERRVFIADERAERPIESPFRGHYPRLSRDAQRYAVISCMQQACDVLIADVATHNIVRQTQHGEALIHQGSFNHAGDAFYYVRGAEPCSRALYRLDITTGMDEQLSWSIGQTGWYALEAGLSYEQTIGNCPGPPPQPVEVLIGLRSDGCDPATSTFYGVTRYEPDFNMGQPFEERDFVAAGEVPLTVRMDHLNRPFVYVNVQTPDGPELMFYESPIDLTSPDPVPLNGFAASTPSREFFKVYGIATANEGPPIPALYLRADGEPYNTNDPYARQLVTRTATVHSVDYAPLP